MPAVRLLPPPPRVAPPELDDAQAAVVDRVVAGGGPLLVLAGPGTGKTTTIVEAVAARVAAGTPADRILALTFSRKAAAELRSRIAARLQATTVGQSAWTFHSFALGALQAAAPEDSLQLLIGPEQDLVVRDLLAGQVAGDSSVRWPEELSAALDTRGFATVLRGLLARARALAMEPADLAQRANESGDDSWLAAAGFFDEYLAVLDAMNVLDYSELVHRAAALTESGEGPIDLRSRFDLVVVDEYQDTDPGQERLLRALTAGGADLVAVGDPDQAIYAFRGAEVRGLLDFRSRFRKADGSQADVLTLRVSRRSGAALLAASRQVASRLPSGGAGLSATLREHRDLIAADGVRAGSVEVLTCATASMQWSIVADRLRREHVENGTDWAQMAVLVRSGVRSLPAVRRGLGAVGVPIAIAADEVPLAAEPAIVPLLTAARCLTRPSPATAEEVRLLLTSPLVGADASAMRRLGRALREAERAATGRPPRPSAELIAEAFADPREVLTLAESEVWPLLRLVDVMKRAKAVADGSGHDLLWALWRGTGWPERLASAAAGGGPAAAAADRDLDAVCALFEAAARDAELGQHRAAAVFLETLAAQEIPAGPAEERAARNDGVRVMTAHRSKGLEWDVVAVVDVQEELWPDIRPRSPLLAADRLGADGLAEPPTAVALLAEERRLFYVAATRARRRLIVTAVDSAEDDGMRPSRFLAELGVPVIAMRRRPDRQLTLPSLIAELRSVAADPDAADRLRTAAVERLARLATASAPDGHRYAPAADPSHWWGVLEVTESEQHVFPATEPLRLSASTISGYDDCALRWFLEHEARAGGPGNQAQGFGKVVHALAAEVAAGRVPADALALDLLIDEVWEALGFPARWIAARERDEARAALQRFLDWQATATASGRRLLAAEEQFGVEVTVGDRLIRMRGAVDRLEVDADGRVVLVDLKTGKGAPTEAEVARHAQLGVYQWAVEQGGFADRQPDASSTTATAAELVHLRLSVRGSVKVQRQQALDGDRGGWVDDLIGRTVAGMAAEQFPATPNDFCDRCSQRINCPARDEGAQVIT